MLSGINIERQDTLRPKVIFNINLFFLINIWIHFAGEGVRPLFFKDVLYANNIDNNGGKLQLIKQKLIIFTEIVCYK